MVNRQQRRAKGKQAPAGATMAATTANPELPRVPASENQMPPPDGKPGLMLRIAATILLSRWALRRVRHPQVLSALREVARQSGNERAWRTLGDRLDLTKP